MVTVSNGILNEICILFSLCYVDCTDGDVRLSMNSEGTVQVCFNRVWGLISENGWTITDAQVVCNQLGYTTDPGESIMRCTY